jgi:phenylacetate-CoA ligase
MCRAARVDKFDRGSNLLNEAGLEAARQFKNTLSRTQYYPKERMLAYQRRLLEHLLRHARAEVPFYEKRLNNLFDRKDDIRWDAWPDIPTFTRNEAQKAGEQMFARNLPAEAGAVEYGQTSGSTGRPLKFQTNSLMRLMKGAVGEQIFSWHKVDKTKTAAFIMDHKKYHPLPGGSKGRLWNLEKPDSPVFQLSLGYTVAQQVEWLSHTKARVLISYPSNAAAILKYVKDNNLAAPFDTVVCNGECLTENVRKFLTNHGNIKVIDRFGASEIGPISAACPENHTIHHQFAEIGLVENLEVGSDVALTSGSGRMVITPFYNYAMPLIRYENEDYIETSDQPCGCGRTLPVINRIVGRRRNLFKFANGKVRWPNFDDSEFLPFLHAHQFQFIQKSIKHIDVLYVPDGSSREPDADKMKSYMQGKLNETFDISIIKTDSIPKLASEKFEDCISLVE